MKAIILAAGMGTRLGNYTKNLPKGMLLFNGKPLIEWQIRCLRRAGFTEIVLVTGYKRESFKFDGVKYYHNPEYNTTNMVETLFYAKEEFNTEVLVAYADILYTPDLIKQCIQSRCNIGVAVDSDWRAYWNLRFGTTECDLETFTIKNNKVIELGKEVNNSTGIDYRYIGLIKFSKEGIEKAQFVYESRKKKNKQWTQSGKPFKQGYMTDLLNEVIISDYEVNPITSKGGWLEFDTIDDYEKMCKELEKGKISKDFFSVS